METNELNNNKINKQKLTRPASILLNVYPSSKGILNWKFSSINESILPNDTNITSDVTSKQQQKKSLQHHIPNTLLTFNEFNYGSYQNAVSLFNYFLFQVLFFVWCMFLSNYIKIKIFPSA